MSKYAVSNYGIDKMKAINKYFELIGREERIITPYKSNDGKIHEINEIAISIEKMVTHMKNQNINIEIPHIFQWSNGKFSQISHKKSFEHNYCFIAFDSEYFKEECYESSSHLILCKDKTKLTDMQEIINFVEYDNIDVLGVNSRRCHNYIPQSKELNEFLNLSDSEVIELSLDNFTDDVVDYLKEKGFEY